MKRLLLTGGGHAHLFVLEAFARAPLPGVELVLVSPHQLAPYSGMMPGVIAGHYHYEQACVDLAPLVRAAGCRWHKTRAEQFDLSSRFVTCENGTRLDFDLLSIDTGSTPPPASTPGAQAHAVMVKPIESFIPRWQQLAAETACRRPLDIAVVGGGAAGVEVVAAMHQRLSRTTRHHHRFNLIHRQDVLLAHLAPSAGHLRATLQDKPLTPWTPQARALALLATGDRRAIGVWGDWVWQGRWVWRWKDRIDRRFVARFAAHHLIQRFQASRENPSCVTK